MDSVSMCSGSDWLELIPNHLGIDDVYFIADHIKVVLCEFTFSGQSEIVNTNYQLNF